MAKKRAIQLMDEYSLNSVLQSAALNADYTLRMNNLADACQKEIAQVKKIHAVYSISQNKIKPQNSNFKLQQFLPGGTDITLQATGSKSYYFEVDNGSTIVIEEEVSGVWTTLQTITVLDTVNSFEVHKGLISPSSTSNNVRLRFTGTFPYNIRNVALWSYSFATDADVPNYTPYVSYTMPTDFFELEKVVQRTDMKQYNDLGIYRWEGRQTFVLPYDYTGSFDIFYFRYPTTIDDNTLDTYTFEVDTEAQEAIPYYLAGHVLMSDPPQRGVGQMLLQEYQGKLANLRQWNYDGFMMIDNPSGW